MTFLLRRLAFAVLLVVAVSSAALVLVHLAPGDYATESLGIDARRDEVETLRARYGLDRSLSEQYLDWTGRAVRLDFGRSLLYDRPVRDLVSERASNTAVLALTALVVATFVGVPLGIVTGSRRGGLLSGTIRTASIVFLSLPPLVTSLVLVMAAAATGWLPPGGMESPQEGGGALDVLRHLVIPATAMALPVAAMLERLQSDAMTATLGQPFVIAALARGVPWRRVVWRGALRVALRPAAAIYGLVVGSLLSGSFAVEMVTAWPGLGRLMFEALRARDVYLVAGCATAGSVFLALGTLLSDGALAVLDLRAAD